MHVFSQLGFKNWEKGWHDIFFLRKIFWINKKYVFQQTTWGYICTGFPWSIHNIPNSNLNWKQWILVRMLRMRRHLPLTVSFSAQEHKWILKTISKGEYLTNYRFWWQRGWEWGVISSCDETRLSSFNTQPQNPWLYFQNKLKN